MTTIVYRDGILAADSRAYSGNSTPIGSKRKVHRLDDGSIVGVSTTKPGVAEAFITWLNEGADPAEVPDNEINLAALMIKPDGSVFYYCDNIMPSGPLTGSFFAIGSGDQYALGALSCGATAEAAVMVAEQHDSWTAGCIHLLPLNEKSPAAELADQN